MWKVARALRRRTLGGLGRSLAGETPAEAEHAVAELLALEVVHELVAVAHTP